MGIIKYEEPKYPVINSDPSVSMIYSNFNTTDYCRITTFTSASLVYGYLAGVSWNVRGPSMYTAGLLGLAGGIMYAYQNSAFRLMGHYPNYEDLPKYKLKK
ncbi:hypothetical protein GOP47_0000565 [Adiantum capillus-veneris]|uniref:NADH-ubiquinone oxidoreductase 21kDa subunit N-terminal domain-containing protein n=2 Tax=Adiantum capillus-veneris TaxID=13818 RepID=A0A9D4VEZ6_ADICA|nr:hypothetical protein GOP47_0000565 [Adiantum capillus-veneris]